MQKKSSHQIIEKIKKVLEDRPGSSIRHIARTIKSEWITVNNNLEFMKKLGLVVELEQKEGTTREGRCFKLKKS